MPDGSIKDWPEVTFEAGVREAVYHIFQECVCVCVCEGLCPPGGVKTSGVSINSPWNSSRGTEAYFWKGGQRIFMGIQWPLYVGEAAKLIG